MYFNFVIYTKDNILLKVGMSSIDRYIYNIDDLQGYSKT